MRRADAEREKVMQTSFRKELEELLNKWSMENGSNTPDWILAGYLESCIEAFDSGVNFRQQWYEARAVSLPVRVVEQRNEAVDAGQKSPDCLPTQHNWKEVYYGYKCERCKTFIPYGSEPWLPVNE